MRDGMVHRLVLLAALAASVACSGSGSTSVFNGEDASGNGASSDDTGPTRSDDGGNAEDGTDADADDDAGEPAVAVEVVYGPNATALDGAILSGVTSVYLEVDAREVESVTYRIDGDPFGSTDDSPFAFIDDARPDRSVEGLDTSRMDDGLHVMEVLVTTTEGEIASKRVSFETDNGVGRAEEWVEIGPEGGEVEGFPSSNDSDVVSPGVLWVEWPTFHSLGFQWEVEGDRNRNAVVELSYRVEGAALWRPGMPLHRTMGERAGFANPDLDFQVGNMFAGSVLFLEPATRYEMRLRVREPDSDESVIATVYLRQSTKVEAMPNEQGEALHVYPIGSSGPKLEPNVDDLQEALDLAGPGTRILLHEGVYSGEFEVRNDGERGNPIAIRPYQNDVVTLRNPRNRDGSSTTTLKIEGDHIVIEELTFEGAATGIRIDPDTRVTGLTIRRCSFEDHGNTIWSRSVLARDITIVDNVFQGGEDSDQNDWRGGFEASKSMRSYKAIRLSGQGVDIGYNTIRLYRDAISPDSSASGEDDRERRVSAWDVYRNDFREIGDDAETDFSSHNVRVFENFSADLFGAWSAQPTFGGPIYILRNVQYNVTNGRAFKLHDQPVGVYVYHNTTFVSANVVARLMGGRSPVAASHIRNNAFWGPSGNTLYFRVNDPTISRLDHNAYSLRDEAIVITYDILYDLNSERFHRGFETIESELGLTEGRQFVRLDDFANVPRPHGTDERRTDLQGFDPRPVGTSAMVDNALPIPNVNDGWAGEAPDIGAYEVGSPLRVYGAGTR